MVSEQDFLIARKNLDNIKIIARATSKYFEWFKQQQFPYLIDFPKGDELKALGDIALWKAMSSFDKKKSCKFSSWLFVIMLQHLSTEIKTRYKGQVFGTITGICDKPMHDNKLYELENNECVNLFIAKLNSVDAKIMQLKFFDKMTLNEIGQQVNLSAECVRRRVKKNLKRLREELF